MLWQVVHKSLLKVSTSHQPFNTLPPKCPNWKKYTSNIFHDNQGSTKALGCECWTNQELREDFVSKDVFFGGGANPLAQING